MSSIPLMNITGSNGSKKHVQDFEKLKLPRTYFSQVLSYIRCSMPRDMADVEKSETQQDTQSEKPD